MVYGIYPRCNEAEPSNPEGITYTTASEESMWLVPQLTAFHQSQAEKSIPLGNTFGFRQLREQRLEKCGLYPITLHFSRPLIGGRQATVVQSLVSTEALTRPSSPSRHCTLGNHFNPLGEIPEQLAAYSAHALSTALFMLGTHFAAG